MEKFLKFFKDDFLNIFFLWNFSRNLQKNFQKYLIKLMKKLLKHLMQDLSKRFFEKFVKESGRNFWSNPRRIHRIGIREIIKEMSEGICGSFFTNPWKKWYRISEGFSKKNPNTNRIGNFLLHGKTNLQYHEWDFFLQVRKHWHIGCYYFIYECTNTFVKSHGCFYYIKEEGMKTVPARYRNTFYSLRKYKILKNSRGFLFNYEFTTTRGLFLWSME